MKSRRSSGKVQHVRIQYGALPFRHADGLEVLLITSRETRRWVIPKGWPMHGRRPWQAAECEALEEAGIVGHVSKRPIGAYTYLKRAIGGKSWRCEVAVFPLDVRSERETWREHMQRERQWFPFLEAAEAVQEPELRSLILAFGLAFDTDAAP